MNNQEAFTKMVKHVLAQKEQCSIPNFSTCLYANKSGNRCAVGVLLPLDVALRMSSARLDQILEFEDVRNIIGGVDRDLLLACQKVHDKNFLRDTSSIERIRKQFTCIAKQFNLEMPT